ncbi:Transcription elongation regulator [Fasciola gigantica]|uniref:Transcription elongation regulator n=1 Tax=Fasciola gigantica TaxID=46835 RepID=A0A504YX38_FASGI|nr:Transcription elongation regulator [Fasciola gigantica]
MSATECEQSNIEPDGDSDGSFRNEDNGFVPSGHFEEEDHYSADDPGKQIEHHDAHDAFNMQVENPMRHVRPMRPQNSMQYRPGPGPRGPYPPGFRGHPRMPMQMGGNSRLPFMRPGMGPRGGPPYENYGPPPMGMPRGCPPPRYPQQPPRYPPMNESQNEEDMEDQQQQCSEMSVHEYDGPPNSNSFQGPGVRLRGPPPFMMGPNGGPHPSGPPGIPHGPPRGGPPYNGPPGQGFNGPQFSGPPMSSSGGPPFQGAPPPNISGPNSGMPFGGPHSGPPFGGPPYPGPPGSNMGPPNFCGPPPTPGFAGHPPGSEYSGQPPPNFNGQQSGPPFSGPGPSRPPFGPPYNGPPANAQPGPPPAAHTSLPPGVPPPVPPANCPPMTGPPPGSSSGVLPQNAPPGPPFSGPPGHPSSQASSVQPAPSFSDSMHGPPPGAPSIPPFAAGPPRPPFPGGPVGIPSSTATSLPTVATPSAASVSSSPAMCPPPVPQPSSTTVTNPFGYPSGPAATSESPQYAVPPGFPGMHPPPARPISMPPGVPPQSMCAAPPGFPLHMMPPPPMSGLAVMPPGLPPFRSSMPFVPPTLPMGPLTPRSQPTTQVKVGEDIWVENITAEGKSYYYNMRTRETRWDRPEGVTLVKQDEVESPAKTSATVGMNVNASTVPQKPPDVAVWAEYHNPEGKAYYHNTKTGETTWEKPKTLVDWEASRAPTTPSSESNQQSATAIETQNSNALDSKTNVSSATVLKSEKPEVTEEKMDIKKEEKPTNSAVESKEETTKTPKDNSRPVSSTAVPGTPWCVVWTGDDRAFFFNPSQRLSVWEKPEELKGRADVDRLLEKRPNANTTPNSVPEEDSKTKLDRSDDDDGSSAAKKPRLDTDQPSKNLDDDLELHQNGPKEDTPEGDKTAGAPDKIPVGMEAAKEAEERAARERAVQPLEVRVKRFREMLVEMQVSAFSTWEKELHKIVFDPRYLLLTSKERRQTFEAYVKERAEEERREKKNKLKEKKEKFVELLEEAGLNSKSSFSDFSIKYQKDERFKAIDKARDRETIYQDFLSELRKREKDEKHREKEKLTDVRWCSNP